MIEITCISTTISLSCEDYTNQGGSYEMYKEEIEQIKDPFSHVGNLRCDRSGINGNPCVTFTGPMPSYDDIAYLLDKIEERIISRLESSNGK